MKSDQLCLSGLNSAKSKILTFVFLSSFILWDETHLFWPQLELCCDCVRCYQIENSKIELQLLATVNRKSALLNFFVNLTWCYSILIDD